MDMALARVTDLFRQVGQALRDRLRPEDRDLIIARIEMGLSNEEMRVMFEKPSAAAVHMALSRALIKLAEEMAHERKR